MQEKILKLTKEQLHILLNYVIKEEKDLIKMIDTSVEYESYYNYKVQNIEKNKSVRELATQDLYKDLGEIQDIRSKLEEMFNNEVEKEETK